jgi:hypothetical protein
LTLAKPGISLARKSQLPRDPRGAIGLKKREVERELVVQDCNERRRPGDTVCASDGLASLPA